MSSKDLEIRKKIIYWVTAFLVLLLLWLVSFCGRPAAPKQYQFPILMMGDSQLGQCRDQTSVEARLSELTGKLVFNSAFGGTGMALREDAQGQDYSKELLCMAALAKAFAADDFGVQQSIHNRQAVTSYFERTVDALEYLDLDSVEVLLLGQGLNDYHAAVPIENPRDRFDETTYAGALRSVVRTMQKRYPGMRIMLVTPTYTWYNVQGLTCEEYDTGNGYLEQYVEAQMLVAEEMGIEVIDLYHNAYTHENWEDWMRYTEDGLHPNEEGRAIIAEQIAQALRN